MKRSNDTLKYNCIRNYYHENHYEASGSCFDRVLLIAWLGAAIAILFLIAGAITGMIM